MKRILEGFSLKTKTKEAKNINEVSAISLHESLSCIIDEDETDSVDLEMDTRQFTLDVIPDNIKDNFFILVKFPKNKSVVYCIEKVMSDFSRTEFKVSYLIKKPRLLWTFVFPNV